MKIPTKVLALVLRRSNGLCELCGAAGTNTHHRRPAGMGGTNRPESSRASNLIRLCGSGTTGCHGWIEHNRPRARELGLLIRQNQNPAEIPAELRCGRVLIGDDGTSLPIPEESQAVA